MIMERVNKYRLDKQHFEKLTLIEADSAWNDNSQLHWEERLELVLYLNSIAYGYAGNPSPKMDKTVFEAGKLDHG
jgi:hypothetical protein